MELSSEALQGHELRGKIAHDFEQAIGKFVPGTLANEERHLYYHLARDQYQGRGEIVELGAFLGASTRAFAAGLRDNPTTERAIKSFDLFFYDDSWGRGGIDNYLTPDDKKNFFQRFMQNLEGVEGYVDPIAGDLLEQDGSQLEPIELLFVDLAKTPELMIHIGRHFLPRIMSGGTYVQQDYLFDGLPFIKAFHEFFWDYFEVIEPNAGSTVLFRMRKAFDVTSDQLAACATALAGDDMYRLVAANKQRFSTRYHNFFEYS